ncbi:MAG: DUF4234 domain-containing protein [Candidatus Aenigmatarchaeota archaeon]|nr:DUF4234 domain-containing protein [Candidatus Aenigmarchaeota archaeon]
MPIEKRNIVLIYLLGIVTLGIYFIYWLWKTKNELNELGAEIPTAWLIIIPFANIYWLYKYSEGFAKVTKKESHLIWFIVFLLVGIVMPAIVQSELNKIAKR